MRSHELVTATEAGKRLILEGVFQGHLLGSKAFLEKRVPKRGSAHLLQEAARYTADAHDTGWPSEWRLWLPCGP